MKRLFFRWFKVAIAFGLSFLLFSSCQTGTNTPDGVVKLTMWQGINPPPNRDVFQVLVDEFNRSHSNIEVEALYVGQPGEQMPKILTSVVGDATPDILWQIPMLAGQLLELEAIQPVSGWLNNSPAKSKIIPSLFESMELNDEIWSVPMATNNTAIFYRPSLFEEAGINKLPETWEEFQEVAIRLTKDINEDGRIDQYGMLLPLGKQEWTVFCWLPFMFSGGGELVAGNEVKINNPGAVKALQLWSDLLTANAATLSAPERGYELEDFKAGRVAMQITGPWTLAELAQSGIDYGVFPIPKDETSATVVGGENLYVMTDDAEKQAAIWEFFEFILSEDFQTKWAMGTGYLPITIPGRESESYQAFVGENPVLETFNEQMKNARSRPIVANYSQISENIGRAVEEVLVNRINPEKALQKADERLVSSGF
jgi:multiple sugar transport system substrate-binding protein